MKMRLRNSLVFVLIIFLIPFVFAITGNSSSYTVESKFDYGSISPSANSSNYTQRYISGEQPVSEYNSSTYAGRFGILQDTTAPVITLTSPADGHSTTSTSINFQYTVSDDSSTNCSLILDGSIVTTNLSVNITGGTNTFSRTGLSVAAHTWSVNCTDIYSNTANSSSRTLTITSAPSPPGGGGGGGAAVPAIKFDLSQYSYETTLSIGDAEYEKIQITNNENSQKSFNILINAPLEGILFLDEDIITLNPRETKDIEFTITAPQEPGIYTGKISVNTGSTTKSVLITINVKTKRSLFDITVNIPKTLRSIKPGENLQAQIDLLQAGIKEKMDVTLHYIIKDFEGVVHVEESETIMVYDKKSFGKEFHTEELPLGDYVLGVELVYPGGVAVASSNFKVSEGFKLTKENIMLIALAGIILFILLMMMNIIKKYKRGKGVYRLKRKRGR